MSDVEDASRRDPTTRLEAALERIAAAVDRRRPTGAMTPDVTQEVAARLDMLIRQIRGVLGPVTSGPVDPGPANLAQAGG